jgi:hypothetical protein
MPKNEKIRNDIIEVLKKATEPMGRAAIVACSGQGWQGERCRAAAAPDEG